MDTKRFLIGMVVGAVILYAVGWLIWGLLFADFFAANVGGATNLVREAPIYWPGILGHFAVAALVTLAIGWSGALSWVEGLKIGAIVGFLLWFGVDFIHYGSLDKWNLTATIVDPILELVRTGIGGAAIGLALARFSKEEPASSD
jgi:hypothetical protein